MVCSEGYKCIVALPSYCNNVCIELIKKSSYDGEPNSSINSRKGESTNQWHSCLEAPVTRITGLDLLRSICDFQICSGCTPSCAHTLALDFVKSFFHLVRKMAARMGFSRLCLPRTLAARPSFRLPSVASSTTRRTTLVSARFYASESNEQNTVSNSI